MTTGEDQHLECVECREDFLFTAGEQAFYRQHGLTHPPTRCKRCREMRKTQRQGGGHDSGPSAPRGGGGGGRGERGDLHGGKEMHAAVCSECGAETMVPFVPSSGRPIFCRDCFQSRKPATHAQPREASSRRPGRS